MSKQAMKQVLKSTLAASLLAGASLVAFAQPMGGHGGHGGRGAAGGEPMMMMGLGRVEHVLDTVDATDAQRAQVRQILQTAQLEMKSHREAGRKLHEQGLSLFAAPVVDANAVEALRLQMLSHHDQGSKRMSQSMVEISRVLTPEQRTKFVERMKKRHARMAQHMGARSDAK